MLQIACFGFSGIAMYINYFEKFNIIVKQIFFMLRTFYNGEFTLAIKITKYLSENEYNESCSQKF